MEFAQGTALPSPTLELVRWFESVYRVTLPLDYVTALRDGNGGIPSRRTFMQGSRERLIERMLCLLQNPSEDEVNGLYDLDVTISQIGARLTDDGNYVGARVVPFAVLFAGDHVCLDYRSSQESPTVSVWDHEQSEDFRPVLETIAETFAEFEAKLR